MRKAIIDIGTNTFNLLVVEYTDNSIFKILHEAKLPVKLGKGSMNDGVLKPDAMERAIKAMVQHKQTSEEFDVSSIRAFATSAVRGAKNKDEFLEMVNKETSLTVEVISGDREAELIYKGVSLAVPLKENVNYLILDIGGGSNEFILCNNKEVLWKKSYDLGIARLLEMIDPHDPIYESDLQKMRSITNGLIPDLIENCTKYNPTELIGASGSFETYVSMILYKRYGSANYLKHKKGIEIEMEDFLDLYKQIICSTSKERLQMPGLPEWRIEMIVLAIAFTKYIIDLFELQKIHFSDYAMKEGVVGELF